MPAEPSDFPVLGLENFHFDDKTDVCLLNHAVDGEHQITAHKHDFYLFFLIEKGRGIHRIDFVNYQVGDRELHILLPGQVHEWTLDQDTLGYQLMLSERVLQTFNDYLSYAQILHFKHPVMRLNEDNFQQMSLDFRALKQELTKDRLCWEIIWLRCRLISRSLTREAGLAFDDVGSRQSNPIVVRFVQLVDEYYKMEKVLAFYAGRLNITANYLNMLCKKYLQLSANTLIQNRLILESKRMLQISDKSIKEIAYELGFTEVAYFSNFFKNKTGGTPRDFRSIYHLPK
ncbi:transcriptional regulator, AraC family protein [Pedobacter sp. BAL39]|uniref:helix-turn-helix domain-containing protein n=1 Tax=Pedobacter sp. BAL39 TaxID=391596 RepID=UPI000155A17C|nr:helix-turn-helix domain-containing protein [Pedobacter sp. BAL39]EDM34947.1 transcriptional regulator, AraC family protein [Pedobacter sp. BAL39]